MIGPCKKQTVKATLISSDGRRWVGTNFVRNSPLVCPRADMPTGVGYHLCREVCDQLGHAEVVALTAARGINLQGAVCYIEGHTYACDPCKVALSVRGITDIRFETPP